MGGLAPLSYVIPSLALGGLIPQPDPPILGGLHLSRADFRTHHAPLPPPHMIGSIDRPHEVSPGNPPPSKTIQTLQNTRLPTTRRTRRQTAILAGTAPSRPDYRLAARSGFAASAASAPPSLRTSPPSRSPRLQDLRSSGLEQRTANASGHHAGLPATCGTCTDTTRTHPAPPPTPPKHPTLPSKLDPMASQCHF